MSRGATQYRARSDRIASADDMREEIATSDRIPDGARIFAHDDLTSQDASPTRRFAVRVRRASIRPGRSAAGQTTAGRHEASSRWRERLHRRRQDSALQALSRRLPGIRRSTNVWTDTAMRSFAERSSMSFRRTPKVVQRCMLMTTDPGDLVLDPTCGSRHDGLRRRAVGPAMDHDRHVARAARARAPAAADRDVPLLRAPGRRARPGGGFVYKRRQNAKGEEVGGIVPHVTLEVDRERRAAGGGGARRPAGGRLEDHARQRARSSSRQRSRRRSTATATDEDAAAAVAERRRRTSTGCSRRCAATRSSSSAATGRSRSKNVRPPAKALIALRRGGARAGRRAGRDRLRPRERRGQRELVYEAVREAHLRSYEQLLVIGFAIEPNAREFVEKAEHAGRHPGDLRPGDARPGDGRPAEDDALEPDLQRRRSSRRRDPQARRRRRQAAASATRSSCADSTSSTRRRCRPSTAPATTCRPGSSTPTTTGLSSTSRRRSSRARAPGTASRRR